MEKFVLSCNGYRIAVYRNGTGPVPLVLLHGGGVDGAMLSWREVLTALPGRYTAYAMDLLGYGQSDRPDDIAGPSFYQTQIAAVEDALRQLGLRRVVISGLSMGGAIAIGYALKNPDGVVALIPVDSWGLVGRMPMNGLYYWFVNTSLLKPCFRLYAKHRWMVRWSLTYSLIGDRRKVTDALVDEVSALCRVPDAEKPMRDFQRSSLTRQTAIPDYTDQLKSLTMPVLFITGEKDALVRQGDVRRASQSVQNGQLHVMKGCKHWSQKERPEEYLQAVNAFLEQNAVTGDSFTSR